MQNTKQTLILAGSILFGFVLIAAAIFFSGTPSAGPVAGLPDVGSPERQEVALTESPKREAEELRRLYGNPEAPTTIVEFSDYECPFCARLHPTLKQVVDESDGAINWEYRHLPLAMHATAKPAAIAAECVGDLAGNDAFWDYSTVLLSNQRGMTTAFLESEAVALGVALDAYQNCIALDEIASRVENDVQSALALGGSGTPFNVIEFADGTRKAASGALPYENWMQILSSN
jgi:protein-disulfide isomerase